MSKRAPSGDAVPVRRATQPSTASSTSATTRERRPASARGVGRAEESATSAATPPTSVARASVTRSAGPSPSRAGAAEAAGQQRGR